jgi:hypothetical protein
LSLRLSRPSRIPQRSAQQELDLPIDAAHFVASCEPNRLKQVGIDTYQEWFTIGHDRLSAL